MTNEEMQKRIEELEKENARLNFAIGVLKNKFELQEQWIRNALLKDLKPEVRDLLELKKFIEKGGDKEEACNLTVELVDIIVFRIKRIFRVTDI